jgi:hypothetical protein
MQNPIPAQAIPTIPIVTESLGFCGFGARGVIVALGSFGELEALDFVVVVVTFLATVLLGVVFFGVVFFGITFLGVILFSFGVSGVDVREMGVVSQIFPPQLEFPVFRSCILIAWEDIVDQD